MLMCQYPIFLQGNQGL